NEQAAAHALRLAIALQEAAKERVASGLNLRIGVNSGFMFCGDVGASHRREYTVLGDAVNLAARLMARAEAAEVIVSEVTASEAGPAFRWEAMLPLAVKGKSMPVRVRMLAAEARATIADRRRVPYFGRLEERAVFASAIEKVQRGHPEVVIVSGEPGSGKSRLVAEMIEPLEEAWRILRADAQSFTASMPFAAWTPVVADLLDLPESAHGAERDARASAAINELNPLLLESAALLNDLLSLSLPEGELLRSLNADSRRERLMSLFGQLLEASARQKPTAVVIEDLQWADLSSREVLASTIGALGDSCILICATSRVAVDLPHAYTAISLAELPEEAADALLSWALGSATLAKDARAEIAEKCRGNPLFLEEVARALVHDGRALGTSPVIPDRLQSLLMAGLDSLPPAARRIARFASVLGTTFERDILGGMLTAEALLGLDLALEDLVASRTIYHDGEGGSRYRFRHSLQQEVAYESLLFARRRELHDNVTSILEARNAGDLNAVVETLAYHTNRSGDARKSARYSTLAGDKARAVYAWESAIVSYNTALQALARLGNGNGQLRSALLERMGDCLQLAGRYGDSADTYVRGLRAWTGQLQRSKAPIAAAPGEIMPLSFDVQARGSQLRLKIAVAFERNSQFDRSLRWLRAAKAVMPPRRPDLTADIFSSWSVAAFRKGQFKEAVELALKALLAARTIGDPARIAYSHHVLANSYGETGRLRRSVFHREQALVIYEQIGDIPRLFAGHGNLGLSYQSLGDFALAVHHHTECIKAAEQIGNEVAAAIGQNNLGEVLLAQGHFEDAGNRFAHTIEVFRRRGEPRVPAGLALVNLSRVALRLGDTAGARVHLAEGLQMLGAVSRGLATEGILQESEIALQEGALAAAAAASARAVDEANALGMFLVESRARLLQSRIEKARGNLPEATARAKRSLAVARRLGAAYEMAQAYLLLAELAPLVGAKHLSGRRRALAASAAELLERIGATEDLKRARELAAG
ncbi:MAG: AAA family ATPase, partial [Tepidiformaceae bacterium]